MLKAGWIAPVPFVAKTRDGKTDIWGIICRPTNFDPTKKYPVIEYIYAGPGSQYTPKTFIPYNWNMSALAELGFIVIQMDAMGTSFRSKAFEETCYKNMKDAGFPDRIAWTKAASPKYTYMDIEHVGIFGASAGGQEFLKLEAKINLIAKFVNEQQPSLIENSDETWVDNYDVCTFLKISERTLQRLRSKGLVTYSVISCIY